MSNSPNSWGTAGSTVLHPTLHVFLGANTCICDWVRCRVYSNPPPQQWLANEYSSTHPDISTLSYPTYLSCHFWIQSFPLEPSSLSLYQWVSEWVFIFSCLSETKHNFIWLHIWVYPLCILIISPPLVTCITCCVVHVHRTEQQAALYKYYLKWVSEFSYFPVCPKQSTILFDCTYKHICLYPMCIPIISPPYSDLHHSMYIVQRSRLPIIRHLAWSGN